MRQFERLRLSADRASESLNNLGEFERARREPPLEELEEVESYPSYPPWHPVNPEPDPNP